jgi:hypothetical protein
VKRYGDDAMLEATQRAGQLLEDGDLVAAANWHRILNALERLQATKPGIRGRRMAPGFRGLGELR